MIVNTVTGYQYKEKKKREEHVAMITERRPTCAKSRQSDVNSPAIFNKRSTSIAKWNAYTREGSSRAHIPNGGEAHGPPWRP